MAVGLKCQVDRTGPTYSCLLILLLNVCNTMLAQYYSFAMSIVFDILLKCK